MKTFLKSVDIVVWVLITIGAFNWGLIGFFEFNLVAFLFGDMSAFTRFIYILVGLASLWEIFGFKLMADRWHMERFSTKKATA